MEKSLIVASYNLESMIINEPFPIMIQFKVHDVEFCHNLDQIVKFTIPALMELKAAGSRNEMKSFEEIFLFQER